MVHVFVWPWKNDEELLEVRGLFYPSAQLDDQTRREKQQLAVNIVNTWKLRRSRIPHSIVATADLVDAIVHDEPRKNSASTIRAVYASALAKLVTSVCDLEQDAAEKRPMLEQARKVGMPEDWVHLRHAVTHGRTPSLNVLRDAVCEAVPWMWEHFWKGLGGDDEVEREGWRGELSRVLTGYRQQMRLAVAGKADAGADGMLVSQTAKAVRRGCKSAKGLDTFVDVLLHDNFLLPSEKQTNLKFKALVLVWDALLLSIVDRVPAFRAKIVSALVQCLNDQGATDGPTAATLKMVSKWLQHLLIDEAWTSSISSASLESLRCDVIEACLLRKTEFTESVMRSVLGTMSGPQAETFRELLAIYNEDQVLDAMDVDTDVTSSEAFGDIQSMRTGWGKPVAVWLPRPIGA